MPRSRYKKKYERYDLACSPLSQKPTQRDLARLLGFKHGDLIKLVNYKEGYIVRRLELINGKSRNLAYPENLLRVVHEKIKFQLNKVILPNYLFSPRKGYSQRDNAEFHLDQMQYLTLDLKQFYPSTSYSMIRNWMISELRMYDDVACLLSKLLTVDNAVSIGSPVSPVLSCLVHRSMFNEIAEECEKRSLRNSVWVDDLTVSGRFITTELIEKIRSIISSYGMSSHKIKIRTGKKAVFITGVGIVGKSLVTPNKINLKIKNLWAQFHGATTLDEKLKTSQELLSLMGSQLFIVGKKTEKGRKLASQMNSLRQKRNKLMLVMNAEPLELSSVIKGKTIEHSDNIYF